MKLKIRKAKFGDINTLVKLTKTPEFIFPGGSDFAKKYLKDFIQRGIFFVAEENKKVAGFVSAQITLGKELWIDMLVVDKKERRRGIGTKLVKKIIKIARNRKMKMVFLDAPLFNKNTIHFYKKLGLKKEKKFVWFTKEF
jgi:ribosomal protein S18 acetylase RimI-like enzyme